MSRRTLFRSYLSLFSLFVCIGLSAQTPVAERNAELVEGNYTISGDAFLQEFADGTVKLVLSEDFSTPVGPDVRILLGPSISLDGAEEIVDLSEIDHFSGSLELELEGIGINDYDFIILFCVSFNQLWASGNFGDPVDTGGDPTCIDNATATTAWVTLVDICPDDGAADSLELRANIAHTLGENYAFLLTDTNEVLLEVIQDSVYDFEGTGPATLRVYGISYEGELDPSMGTNRMQTTASGCFTHSSSDLFLTVTKEACQSFECQESLTATHAWVTEVDNCSTDGEADEIFIQNNIMTPPGDHYVFLLTDTNEVLLEVINDTIYNFEGAGTEDLRVYGLSYDGALSPAIGEDRTQTTAENCYQHSGDNLFLTIRQTAACATRTIDRDLSDRVLAYPNPAGDWLRVEWPRDFRPNELQLFDMTGRLLLSQPIGGQDESMRISTTDLAVGSYVLSLAGKENLARKIVWVER